MAIFNAPTINQNLPQVNPPTNKDSHCIAYAVISCVAFAAIALIVSMVVCLHFELMSPVVAYSLMGVGGAALLADFIACIKICFCTPNKNDTPPPNNDGARTDTNPPETDKKDKAKKKKKTDPDPKTNTAGQTQGKLNTKNKSYSISVASWNIGLGRDYSHMCYVREQEKNGVAAGQALATVFSTPFTMRYPLQPKDYNERLTFLEETFATFNHPDILCLQECRELPIQIFEKFLPGYTCLSSGDTKNGTKEHVIAWDSSKFTLLGKAVADYSLLGKAPSNPAFMVHLQDNATKKTVCVCSSHFPGYNLNWKNIADDNERVKQLKSSEDLIGYAECELDGINKYDADLNLHMGDYNTMPEDLPDLFKTFRDIGYATDLKDTTPTIYDVNMRLPDGTPAPLKIDHIHASAKENVTVSFKYEKFNGFKLNQFTRRPSDHLPVLGVATATSL